MGSLPKQIRRIIKIEVLILLLILVAFNPVGSSFLSQINSREFFSHHIRDAFEYFSGANHEAGDFYIATGTYESGAGGELFGAARGRNLILVQLESFQNMVIGREYYGQEITPSLNELIASPGTVYFNNFYYQIGAGNTSDAEFAVNNSIMASMESYTYQLYKDNYFRGLPWILKERGYDSYVLHGYKKEFWNRQSAYPAFGFKRFYSADDFIDDNIEGIGGGNIVGISDSAFFDQATDYMSAFPQPFYSMVITLSCHNPFLLPAELRGIEIMPGDDNIVGNYINAVHYTDRCVGEFMDHLIEKGLYNNSVIVFYGDHFGLSKADRRVDSEVSDWLGEPYRYDTMMNVPLIIHLPGAGFNAEYENSGGQLDLMPTLAYLLGFEALDTVYFGQNLFSGEDSLVAVQVHMLKGSYIKGDRVFEISRDGIFKNSKSWNRKTGEETDIDDCLEDSEEAVSIIELSQFYLANDVLRLVYERGMEAFEISELVAGNRVAVPATLEWRYVESEDGEAIGELFNAMKMNKDKNIILFSDDIFKLLTKLDKDYSGKARRVGHASFDDRANAEYLDVRKRIVPAAAEGDVLSKIEYLGYDRIMAAVSEGAGPDGDLRELIESGEVCGVIMPRKNWLAQMNIWSGSKIPIFIYDAKWYNAYEVE